jgi:hypothetical protein
MAFALALDIIRLRLIKVRLWGTLREALPAQLGVA